MKKMAKLVSATFLAMLIFAGYAMGQNENTLIKLNRNIRLNGDSEKEEVKVEVNEKTKLFFLKIRSDIRAGALTIEISDPNGEKKGNFSVGSQINMSMKNRKEEDSKSETVHGEINKIFKEPLTGNWIIKIIPAKSHGIVRINTKQDFDTNMMNNALFEQD
jgi:hypothetical protein